jgi:probable HAF family extracellular repeat protein
MTDLGVLAGGTASWAFGVNDDDVVVGTSNVTGGAYHAFIWDEINGLRDLNDLIDAGSGWTLTRATDINNDGLISGWGTNGSGDVRGYILTTTCGAGGGAARSETPDGGPMASGFATADATGALEVVVVDADEMLLGEIVIDGARAGAVIEYSILEPGSSSSGRPGPASGTRDGFFDGIGMARTFNVSSSDDLGAFTMTVTLMATAEELAVLEADPAELELHVLDTELGSPPGVWVPAGTNVGEASPTGVLGDSGFVEYADGNVDYWAVRDKLGIFAVGLSAPTDDEDPQPPPTTRRTGLCGIGLFLPLWMTTVFLAIQRKRRCQLADRR